MKLFHSPTSPFVRKVMVAALESGQADAIEVVAANPQALDPALVDVNAISKVPALITDEGVALPESDAICLYLAERSGGDVLLPRSGKARWQVIRQQALADGFMEAAVARRGEDMRPAGERSQPTVDKLMDRMLRCLDALDAEAASFGSSVDLGAISTACACGYAEFRYGDLDWRTGRPALADFYASFAARPSMQATLPPA